MKLRYTTLRFSAYYNPSRPPFEKGGGRSYASPTESILLPPGGGRGLALKKPATIETGL